MFRNYSHYRISARVKQSVSTMILRCRYQILRVEYGELIMLSGMEWRLLYLNRVGMGTAMISIWINKSFLWSIILNSSIMKKNIIIQAKKKVEAGSDIISSLLSIHMYLMISLPFSLIFPYDDFFFFFTPLEPLRFFYVLKFLHLTYLENVHTFGI